MSEPNKIPRPTAFKPGATTYEFRVWGSSVTTSEAELKSAFGKRRQETRTDIYLPPSQKYLPKLRGGNCLELKVRREKLDGIEIWERRVSEEFPVPEQALARFQPCLPDLDLSRETFQSPERTLAFLREHTELMPVTKNRALYEIEIRDVVSAEVELTAVSFKGLSHKTLAIECSDHQTALNLVSELRLGRFENVSYADWLLTQTE